LSSKRKTKNEILLENIQVIKDLLQNLYSISKQLTYISQNNQSNFSVSDTTYVKFLNEYLPKEYQLYKKNLYFKTKLSQIKAVTLEFKELEAQYMILNFSGYINGNTKLDLNFEDYRYFMENYYKSLTEGMLEILCQSDRIYSKGLNNESNTCFNRCI